MDIKDAINKYMADRKPKERYSSFDYCYNYFYDFYKQDKIRELSNEKNLQISCLQLGFYLASWGMLRPSSFLIDKSAKHYTKLIKKISQMEPELWEIDVDNYNENNVDLLIERRNDIFEVLKTERNPTETLLSKIMLGVFGNVPAFDTYFKASNIEARSFSKKSLLKIQECYISHKSDFDSFNINTINFSGHKTDNKYTIAKLIDMYGFIDGQEKLGVQK